MTRDDETTSGAGSESGESTRVLASGPSTKLTLPASVDVLRALASDTEAFARKRGFADREIGQIQLALDEIATNAITHGSTAGGEDTFQVELIPLRNGLCVRVTDHGQPFDFDEKLTRYNANATVDQPIGGIGLYLAWKSVDRIWHESSPAGGNTVAFIKYLPAVPDTAEGDSQP